MRTNFQGYHLYDFPKFQKVSVLKSSDLVSIWVSLVQKTKLVNALRSICADIWFFGYNFTEFNIRVQSEPHISSPAFKLGVNLLSHPVSVCIQKINKL